MLRKTALAALLLLAASGAARAQLTEGLFVDPTPVVVGADGPARLDTLPAIPLYNNLAAPPAGYNAFPAGTLPRAGVGSFDDYVTVAPTPTFLLTGLSFVGGISNAASSPAANRTLFFEFFDTAGAFVDDFGVVFNGPGAFLYDLTPVIPVNFVVPSSGFFRVSTNAATQARFFLTSLSPSVGSTAANPPGLTSGGLALNYAFSFTGAPVVPEPGSVALLFGAASTGLLALRRRRK